MASTPPLTVPALRDRTYKQADAWWTVFVVDPIAIRVVWAILRLWPRANPNLVTLSSLLFGLAAAVAFGRGLFVVGAILYQVSFLGDCVDGKVARWRGVASGRGAFYDGLTNTAVYVAALLGLGWWLAIEGAHPALVGVGLLLAFRGVTLQANLEGGFAAHVDGGWSRTWRADTGSWLTRHRLLPPFSFPDKHAILFLVGPVLGGVGLVVAIYVNVALELLLLAYKIVRSLRTLTQDAQPRGQSVEGQATTR